MSEMSLFPCWCRVQQHPRLPVFYKRVLFVSESGRSVDAVLSLVSDQAHIAITLEESGNAPLPIVSRSCDGVSSLARAMTWGEWVISDYEATQAPPKRAKRGSKRSSVRNIEGEAA